MNKNTTIPARVLVTGGRGFIGTHLVNALRRHDVEVSSVDIAPADKTTDTRRHEIQCDIRDRQKMSEIFATNKFDCILDLASYTEVGLPLSAYQRNVEQTQAMVEYCNQYSIPKYIFYSTQFVFRTPEVLPQSDVDFAPMEAYGQSKVLSEKHIRENLPVDRWLILRPSYIWGPGLNRFRDGLMYRLAKRQFLISSNPAVKRYYGYVETVAEQTVVFASNDIPLLPNKVYYLSDDAITLQFLCDNLIRVMGCGKAWQAPQGLIRILGDIGSAMKAVGLPAPINSIQAHELTTNYPIPIERTLALTGKFTDYATAAQRTVDWALQYPPFQQLVQSGRA